jgi:hypothetical protein
VKLLPAILLPEGIQMANSITIEGVIAWEELAGMGLQRRSAKIGNRMMVLEERGAPIFSDELCGGP